jgi:hypothetical protein
MSTGARPTRTGNNGVRANLTGGRERGQVENKEFAAFAKRIVKAFSRRVAQGDVEALTDLLAFAADLDVAIQDAVDGLREFGYSWAEIAARAGMKRQSAYERWGPKRATATTPATSEAATSHVVCTVQLSLFTSPGGQS